MQHEIELVDLYKSFEDVKAVTDVSFFVNKGEMFGLVGPDGAGKSTVIKMMCGLVTPDKGTVSVFGLDIAKKKKEVQNRIGYLSQRFTLYGDLSVDENIEFFADIHGVKNYKARRDELLEFTRLTSFRERLADRLSGGMKQKLALACSLIHKPHILFLDEPTTGVDPVSRRDFWKILSGLLREGITILMTTPYLDEAERCNRTAFMNNGKIIGLDTPQDIKKLIEGDVIEIICSPVREAYKIVKNNLGLEVQMFGDRMNVFNGALKKVDEIISVLKQSGITVSGYRKVTPSLENVFIHLVERENDKGSMQ